METVCYEKRKGSSGTEGVDYQLNLILTTWLRANNYFGENFQILSEWEPAGNLDDVVLKYEDNENVEHYRFLQAKHVIKEEKTITYEDLISSDKFKIEKYFKSFEDPKNFNVGKIDDLILFTNLALHDDLLSYVDALPANDPIFHFHQQKSNGDTPNMHKLNSKFIDEYKYSKLRCIVKSFVNCCVNGLDMKSTDNFFIECQFVISTDIVCVENRKFKSNFIDSKNLSEGTAHFRRILLEELGIKDDPCLSPDDQKEWMRNIPLIFAPGFGKSQKNKKAKVWQIETLTPEREKLFKHFCELFILATNQPNERELISYIETECKNHGRTPHVRLATLHLKNEIRDWYKNGESPYPLNSNYLKKAIGCIENDKMGLAFINETERSIDELSSLKLEFRDVQYEEDLKSFLQQSEQNLFHLNTNGYMKVSLQKLFNCLKKLQQIDYLFCPRAKKSKIVEIIKVFRDSEVFKILVCEMPSDEMSLEFMNDVLQIINENRKKKAILVTNFGNGDENDIYHPFRKIEDLTYYQDLTEETKKLLLKREIFFQGAYIAFDSIYEKEIPPRHQDIQSWGALLDEQIAMNKMILNSDLSYYINRTLTAKLPYFDKETIEQRLGDQHIVTYSPLDFIEGIKNHSTKHVHMLYELDDFWCVGGSNREVRSLSKYREGMHQFEFIDKNENFLHQIKSVFVISDMAGYGKTTTTSFFANQLQEQYPNCWVTRLQPAQLHFDPEEMKLTPEADICKYDAFLMEKVFNLSTRLERFIFKQYLEDEESSCSQLFFIFDGFDEIHENYQRVIVKALSYLKMKPNVKLIGISTRPQHQELLEEELQSVTFMLRPFNHENKITFLEKFWLSRGVKGEIEKLRDYSNRLIGRISHSISDEESELTGIPLQMRMIGEIFERDAITYLAGNLKDDEIIAVDLFGLYEQFLKKKEDVFLNDKVGAIQSTVQRSIIIKPFWKIQTEFAIKIILGGDSRDLKEELKDSIGFGIIQQNQDGWSFIHRTFAEFLTARYFLDYTRSVSIKVKNGQLMQVLCHKDNSVVRKFINSKLDYKEIVSEFINPNNEGVTRNIEHQQFEDAIRTSVREDTYQVLCFLLEFYHHLHPKEMKEYVFRKDKNDKNWGLLYSLCDKKKFPPVTIHWMTTKWLKSDSDSLLQTLSFLIRLVFLRGIVIYSKLDAEIVIDLQDRLEEEQILSEENLKNILFEIPFDEGHKQRWDELTNINYLKHLKLKHEQLFYSFLGKHKKFVQDIVSNEGNEFYELIGETSEPNFVFDILVVAVFTDFKFFTEDFINLESYLKYLSNFIRRFDPQQLKVFQMHLLEYCLKNGWNYVPAAMPQGHILFAFLRNHRDIIPLDEFMQNIKVHKNLSFIENCALWGWTEVLEFILDAGDIEAEVTERLKLGTLESLDDKRKNILKSIRERYSDQQLGEIARATYQFHHQNLELKVTILSKAILLKKTFYKEIYTTWITSEELFGAFMTGVPVNLEGIKYAIERFPQYKMRFFEINKNGFVGSSQIALYDILRFLEDDNIINKEEYFRLLQLQNDDGETILFTFCRDFSNLVRWLTVMKSKCSLNDIMRVFRMKDVKGRTVFNILNDENLQQCRERLLRFFNDLNLVELKDELENNKAVGSDDVEISEDMQVDGDKFTVVGDKDILRDAVNLNLAEHVAKRRQEGLVIDCPNETEKKKSKVE